MGKKIIHIAPDEKFIDAAYRIYEKAFPGENLFLIIKERDELLEYISKSTGYVIIDPKTNLQNQVERYVTEAVLVVFHGMNEQQAIIATQLGEQYVKVWTVFGYEVYGNHKVKDLNILGPLTTVRFQKRFSGFKDSFRIPYSRLFRLKKHPDEIVLKAFKAMDYIGLLYFEEVEYYKKLGILSNQTEWVNFTYYPLGPVVKKDSEMISKNDILVGNSAFPSGNHLEVFDILRNKALGQRKLIVPLSYGRVKYRNYIVEKGLKIFKDKFQPLIEFLPLTEYQQLIQSCGIVVMNNYRQQAVGNILDMLYRGARVFLTKRNTFYHYLKRIGCYVYTVEDDLVESKLSILEIEKQLHNREVLSRELSMNNIVSCLQKKFEEILK